MQKILIVDDEKNICRFLSAVLSENGYEAIVSYSGESAIEKAEDHDIDLMLLDIGLPNMNGFRVIRAVREAEATNRKKAIPIIVISARSHERDVAYALDIGADDYMKKPLRPVELLARIKNALRHAELPENQGSVRAAYRVGALTVDYEQQQAFIDGSSAHLTKNEFRIIGLLARKPGKILPYEFIIKTLWGAEMKGGNRILRVNVANIRRKIEKSPAEPEYILTETGIGYMIREDET